jgi:hypothetical protein
MVEWRKDLDKIIGAGMEGNAGAYAGGWRLFGLSGKVWGEYE